MNKNRYRIIFNAARGLYMAVAETAAAAKKAVTKAATAAGTSVALASIVLLVGPSQAQIVADPSAPANQRPTVLAAPNGTPLVNIQTPSAAGVSRNTFTQLDVNQQGAIFNNSRTNVQTQLGGWVQGNPWLAGGSARIIFNEINSTNPSRLNGHIEIAGSRAQFIMANPAGITCNGCGFINANRAALTTGAPIMNNGNLDGFRVQGGTITITGAGMDASQTDYTDIIARAVQLNAGVWANQLSVTAGSNQVSADHTQITSIANAGAAPAFAIDVAQLGGMYAGKITLVGTEAGVGVRNAGNVAASSGQLIVTSAGQLTNTGLMQAVSHITAQATDLFNTGGIYAQDNLNATVSGNIANSGTGLIAAAGNVNLNATSANSQIHSTQGTVLAGGMQIDGTLSGSGQLNLSAASIAANGQNLSAGDQNLTASTLDIRQSQTVAQGNLSITANTLSSQGSQMASLGQASIKLTNDYTHNAQLQAVGNASIETASTLTIEGSVQAGQDLTLTAATLDNQAGGQLKGSNLKLTATSPNTFINRGTIDGVNTVIETITLNNLGTGKIYGDTVALGATTLNNLAENGAAPVIASRGRLDIGAQTINNSEHALILSGGDMLIGGSLDAAKQATGQATVLNNGSASIESLGNLSINAAQINNTNNHYSSKLEDYDTPYDRSWTTGDVNLLYIYNAQVTKEKTVVVTSDPALIAAQGDISINGGTLTNDKSHIVAGRNLNTNVAALNNIDATGFNIVHEKGSYVVRTHEWGGWWGGDSYNYSSPSAFSQDVVTTITLPVTRKDQNTNPSITSQVPSATANTAVRTASAATTILPSSSLYSIKPAGNYLVETDPTFANYRTWLSSNYMLAALTLDPTTTQKRLGDGFYEQRLVGEQMAQLTGRRFNGNYASDEAQYQALMDNGVTFAQAHQLTPGIALSAAQMAQLTSDIVWLVAKQVSLPDGSTQTVLTPQVYVALKATDLNASGTLLAGSSVNLTTTGDITNSGTIAGRTVVNINTQNLQNLGGRIQGDTVELTAAQNINNIGGQIGAQNSLTATAGQDINLTTTTSQQTSSQGERVNVDRVATLYVNGPAATLSVNAAGDLNLTAAQVSNTGTTATTTTTLSAGRNVNLATVQERSRLELVRDASNYRKEASSQDVGSTVQTSGNLTIQATQDINAKAAAISSTQGAINLVAGGNINLLAGQASSQLQEASRVSSKGLFSSKSISDQHSLATTTAQQTGVSGNSVSLQAGQDVTMQGAGVVSSQNNQIQAQNINILAAQNTYQESRAHQESRSGLMGSGGFGVTLGSRELSTTTTTTATSAQGSTVGAVQGNVILNAAKNYTQVGSDVSAPGGDVTITAQKVNIQEARETSKTETKTDIKQSGLTLALSNPVVSAVQTAQQMAKAASKTTDPRMKALAAANAALAANNAQEAIKAGQGSTAGGKESQIPTGPTNKDGTTPSRQASAADKVGGINLSLSLGSSSSQSSTVQSSDTAKGSTVQGGKNITITASGAGASSDLTIQGSTLSASNNLTLQADNNVNLLAAKNTSSLTGQSSSSSSSVGISAGTSQGLAVTASVSGAKGSETGNDQVWSNTTVQAGKIVSITSGADTTLKGAVASGEQVQATVGGNLNIQSLQDSSTYTSQDSSFGANVAIGIKGGISGGVQLAKSKIDSDYASVTQQSALRATDGGFQVNVAGDTTLTGGAITSSQEALDQSKNTFQTGGKLSLTDIENKAHYQASSQSLSLGTSLSTEGKLTPQGSGFGFGSDSASAASTTQAAISGIAGNKDARTGDAESGIVKIFDQQKVKDEVAAQTQITQLFGQQASKAIGDYAQAQMSQAQTLRAQAASERNSSKAAELLAQAQTIESNWGNSGTMRVLAHTVVGGLTGGGAGAAGAAAGTLAAPVVAQALSSAGVDAGLSKALTALASTAIGSAVGGTAGAASALNEVTNNYLSHAENLARLQARKGCEKGDDKACGQAKQLDALDQQRDTQFHAACDGALSTSAGCANATRELYTQLGSYASTQARTAAAGANMAEANAANKAELQSYLPLIATASPQVRTSTSSKVSDPSQYTADPYGVIDKNNQKDAYLVMKFGSQALAVANVYDKALNSYFNITSEWGRNGMNNPPSYAAGLMLTHVDAAMDLKQRKDNENSVVFKPIIPVDRYTLSYAPTGGFFSDISGTLETKLGFESASILGLRSQIEATNNRPTNWIVHSRGGVDFVAAAAGSSMDSLKNISVVFHSGANTQASANSVMTDKKMTDVIGDKNRFRDAPNDLVPQVVGLHGLTSPLDFLTSILMSPCLSSTFCTVQQSPHTLPYKWPNLKKD